MLIYFQWEEKLPEREAVPCTTSIPFDHKKAKKDYDDLHMPPRESKAFDVL